jgi:gliding motility-associated protein GldE
LPDLNTINFLLTANSSSVTFEVILFLFFLLLSFIVSGAEVAFSGLRSKELNLLKTKADLSSRRIIELLEKPRILYGSLISAHLFFYLGVVILGNLLMNEFFQIDPSFPWAEMIIKTILIATILLLFCEILPKVWARQNQLLFATFSSWWIHSLVFPLFKITGSRMADISGSLEKYFSGKAGAAVQAEELEQAIELMSDEEATREEKEMLKGIQQFSNILVKQVMRSRLDVSGIEESADFQTLLHHITEQHYSRFPVYRQTLDEIVGMLHTKDLLAHINEPSDFHWQQLLRTPYFVPEQKLIEDLLKEFQQKHIHFAVVVDEFGGTCGIITMEDILEEIIGDIKDEFDEEESINVRLDEHNFLFEGKTMIHDVCRIMHLPLDAFDLARGDSESLAGLVLELAEHLPKTNETVHFKGYTFTVTEVSRNRIDKVKITTPS